MDLIPAIPGVGGGDAAADAPPPSEGSQVSNMPGGDYVIHILI